MSEDLLILGAGYVGERLARAALGQGVRVCVTSRDTDKLATLASLGARTARWDALEGGVDAISSLAAPGGAVVYSVPTIFRSYEPDRHVAPAARAMRAARSAGAERFVYYSSTSVYGDHGGDWIDENSTRSPMSDLGKMRVDIEDAVLANLDGFSGSYVARLVGIYGPGRTLADYLRRGVYTVARPEKVTNRVHVDDIVSATFAILRAAAPASRVFDVTDGSPQTVSDMVALLVDELGLEPPPTTTVEEVAKRSASAAARWRSEYRCRGARLRDELGWAPSFADALTGYRAMIAAGEISPAP